MKELTFRVFLPESNIILIHQKLVCLILRHGPVLIVDFSFPEFQAARHVTTFRHMIPHMNYSVHSPDSPDIPDTAHTPAFSTPHDSSPPPHGLVMVPVAVVMVDLQRKVLTDPLNRPRQIFTGCIFCLSEDIFDRHPKIWFRHVVLFDVFLPDAAEFDLISVRESLWFSVFFLCLNCLIDFPNKWFFEFYLNSESGVRSYRAMRL